MLVARRDPPLHAEATDDLRVYGHPVRHTSRFMTAVQVIGTLVGIPVGLASVYSIYQSNFTVEARCATLRGNIVSMLDKSADASTLRMLVRRDVVTFETNCGAVDPDAVKAFRALLTAKVVLPAPAAAPPQQAAREPVHQAEPVKQVAAPKPAPAPVAAEAKPVEAKPFQRDAETSDAKWISSVRDALVHAPETREEAVAAPAVPAVPQAPPAVQPPMQQPPAAPQPRVVHEAPPPPAVPAAPPMSLAAPVAPALPPPVPVAAAPAPPPAADHPVPPASIPDPQPAAKPVAATSGHSWLAKIPLVNRVIGD